MKKMKSEILKFQSERDWKQFHTPENLAKSIAIEAAELLECFQWQQPKNQAAVEEELADVVNYCILMADALGVDLETIVLNKLKKNAIKYPIAAAKGNTLKYDALKLEVKGEPSDDR
ncbi:MAG: nucleotide pyrophosphohydrolase [Erysipelotrichaceae bacterium]